MRCRGSGKARDSSERYCKILSLSNCTYGHIHMLKKISKFLQEGKTDLCNVLFNVFLQVLWDFQGDGAPPSLSSLPYLLLMVFGMSKRVVVFIQQLQLLDHVTR